jgi:N12 class adenine-specific DNA methylase/predicted RNA methylase
MTHNKTDLIREIQSAFSLDDQASRAALTLLEARAAALDYSLDEYLDRYHPGGIAARDDGLDAHFSGYVDFLGGDAAAIIRAGKSADFSTFVHECAHVFRRQLAGDLRETAEQAFGVTDGKWTREQEEDFARGLERWVEKRRHKNPLKREVYRKGGEFVDTVYRGVEHIIDVDPRMEAVYEKLFEDNRYTFNPQQFDDILRQTAEGKLPESSHVFLGLTPRIYEELGLERLPMAITAKHLYTTLRDNGVLAGPDIHYHDLGPDILRQIPEQLKKPLCIVQSENDETDIISVIALRDKQNRQIIVPIAQGRKGYVNNMEIDFNLVKTLYGKDGFENWLTAAIDDDRLLYLNKKETEPALNENLITLSNANSISQLRKQYPLAQDVSGFYTDNITRFRQAVKDRFGERPFGLRRLYRTAVKVDSGQLAFDFGPSETNRKPVPNAEHKSEAPRPIEPVIKTTLSAMLRGKAPRPVPDTTEPLDEKIRRGFRVDAPPVDIHSPAAGQDRLTPRNVPAGEFTNTLPGLSLPNIPQHFTANFVAMSAFFQNDRVEAARYLLRLMPKPERDSVIAGFRAAGHNTPQSIRDHLSGILEHAAQTPVSAAENAAPERNAVEPDAASRRYRPFGAWTDFNRRLSVSERGRLNAEALKVLDNAGSRELNDLERGILRRYSGFGGVAAENERGVLYDYYTAPPVADLVWRLLDKTGAGLVNGASVLEPSCGTGVFFETAPADRSLKLTGVELDGRTAAVATALREQNDVEIINQSFEAFNRSEKHGGFDYVIGNAPFGERSPETAAIDLPREKSLDNYFVSRSIDNLKPGGIMALIVAPGVLENKSNEQFRLEMNRKAQFAGAAQLPNKSFNHANTAVQPDILLFRKYPDDIINRLSVVSDETFKTTPLYDNDFVSGDYFSKHPEHIMGTISAGTGQWGADEVIGEVTPETIEKTLATFIPADTDVLENACAVARSAFPPVYSDDSTQTLRLTESELEKFTLKNLSAGELKTHEKKLYLLTDRNEWLRVSENETLAQKIDAVKTISAEVTAIRERMRDRAMPDRVAEAQASCIELLDAFQTKYGALPQDDADIQRFTREYPAVKGVYESFLALDDPLLTRENIYRKDIETVDGHNRAVTALLSLREQLKTATDEHIRAAFPADAGSLIAEMKTHPDIFITPEGEWRLREDFISGDAWKQIDALREAAASEREPWKKQKLLHGADEFETAVGWTPIEDAAFSPRSSWIPPEIVRDWAAGKDGLGHLELSTLSKNNQDKWGVSVRGTWEEAADPLVYYLNGQKQRSRNINTDAFNAEHDDLFRSFISNHEQYREQLERRYNRAFKTHIVAPVKTYPVDIAGWKSAEAGGKTLKPHQWQSIHHLYRQGSGISALGTGFGKTAAAVGLMSLLRQEGKSNRVFLQVPNNKVKDWIAEINSVMPSLKIAAIDPEEPGYSSRDKRYAKYQAMARGDADIIIMPESAASEIQLSPKNDSRISDKVAAQYKLEKADASARARELAEIKGERKAAAGKTNRTVSFEDFGCDCVIVDEAHNYKNLFSSSLSRETGMNDGRQSAKAMSLFKKSEFIREQNNGKNVFLLTATPLTNSPLEYYNMLQYIAPEELQRLGVHTIDGFIREFAHIEMGWIYDWGKGQAKEGRVLTGFKNLPTLQNLFFTYTDLQNNPDAIGIEKPLAENRPNVIPRDERQVQAVKSISDRLDRYKDMDAQEREINFPGENFLTFYSQMRAASLDLELYDPHAYKGWKNPKLETLAKNAFDSYQNTKGGQVVFCDRVFSSDASFNIHEKIKNALVVQGFKEKDIVIVNGFTKSGGNKRDGAIEKEVSKAIADYNAGKYKVIIASTACAGEGVNLQKNSAALHHFDIPFRPSDFIQRNGRIDRQGNEQDNVTLHTYLAAGTIDNYSVNLVQRKANWIDQLLRTKSEVFTNPNDENAVDADELLLALTEDWGDKQAARERRAEMEKTKREKIREAQTAQTHSYMKNLSLARASLAALEGRENTKAYQKRCEQIAGLEKALARNETFTHKDILQSREPFLYNQKSGAVFRTGDVLVTRNGSWLVESLNSKKQELNCSALVTDTERGKKEQDARAYGTGDRWKKTSFKVSELEPEGERYNYNAVLSHFEKPDAALRAVIRDAAGEDFYRLPDNARANYYDLHLKICGERYGGFRPATLSIGQSGKLAVEHGFPANRKPLNPFSPEGKAAVDDALKKGLDESVSGWQTALVTLQNALPDVGKKAQAAADSQAQTRREAEQHAEGAEQNRKNQALQKALAKLNPNVTVTSPVVKTGRSR